MAIDNFAIYVHGKRFTLLSDCKPLEVLSTVHTKTLNCLKQQMLKFNFDCYKEGIANTVVDAVTQHRGCPLDDSGSIKDAQRARIPPFFLLARATT